MVSETVVSTEVVKYEAGEGKDRKNMEFSGLKPLLFQKSSWTDDNLKVAQLEDQRRETVHIVLDDSPKTTDQSLAEIC